jgi:hypothetical protein
MVMKRILNIMLSLLIFFSTSLCVSSQSDQKDLDQVKLVKQMLGTWTGEIGKDSIYIVKAVPIGDGIISHFEWQYQGKIYDKMTTITGFTPDKKSIVTYFLQQDGVIVKDIGKFISPTKMMLKRYHLDQIHPVALSEVEFPDPDTWIFKLMGRGQDLSWEPAWTYTWKSTRVKE